MERRIIRNKLVSEGRAEIYKSIKEGNHMDWIKREYGLNDVVMNEEFFRNSVKEIEKRREESLVYDRKYKNHWLYEWRKKNGRRKILKEILK